MSIARMLLFTAILHAFACVPGGAAATVSPENGTVFVNDGNGYAEIQSPADAPPGSQIMVRPGGSALIVYSPGCVIHATPGQIWIVEDKPPCAGAYREPAVWRTETEPQNAVQTTGATNANTAVGPIQNTQLDTTTLLIGGGVLIGGVALAATFSGKDKPASP